MTLPPKPIKRKGPSPAQIEQQKAEELRAINRQIALLERQQKILAAREDLLAFTQFTMPDHEDPDDVNKSSYQAAAFHREVAKALNAFERGDHRQLIFCMPPRHGKTEMATKRLAAWYMGRHPTENVAVAAYSDTLAQEFGSDVRSIIGSPQYKQVFPDLKLRRGGNAKDNLETEQGGRAIFVGRGGALTGRGAHCFPGDTVVNSENGPVEIKDVLVGQRVLSYDFKSGKIVWRRVEAVSVRPRARLFRVSDNAGRVVEATGDHLVYTGSGWREAAKLAAGDRLLCAVWDGGPALVGGRGESDAAGPHAFLLQHGVLEPGNERQQARSADVYAVRSASAEGEGRVRIAESGPDLLLSGVYGSGTGRGNGRSRAGEAEAVREVQFDVCPGVGNDAVLLTGVQGPGALSRYVEGEQSALERRCECAEVSTAQRQTVPRNAALGDEEGRAEVRLVRRGDRAGSTPHRREPDEQPHGELGDAVQAVPRNDALFRAEGSAVVAVEDTGRDAVVYDIQVEGTHCFFANGILCHNCLIIDDLYKDHEEARSQAIRDQAWNWFTKVAMTRRMGKRLVIITMTRWHSDDIIGRLTDPENPCYNEIEARKWKIIRLPAIAEDDDPLCRVPGEPLWPERYDMDFLLSQQRLDPLGFAALYQQRPTVADGIMFRRETIQYYRRDQLPSELRIYAASDHAVGTAQRNDPSCFVVVGVDQQSNIYVLDCWWERKPTDVAVEAMLDIARARKPLLWWAERGHISKSIGPFLYKRMQETGTWVNIREVTPVADKQTRAQAIAARAAMGKVYFPKDAFWTEKAINEMLAFPNGLHDDFVDCLAYIGLGLQSQVPASAPVRQEGPPKYGTLAWVKYTEKWQNKQRAARAAGGF